MSKSDFKRLARGMAGTQDKAGSAVLYTVVVLISVLGYWSSWAELDIVTRGEGRVVSSIQNQLIQATESGVILRRFISENSVVAEGDVMFEIDPVDASSEFNRLNQRLVALDIKEIRLSAEIDGAELFVPRGLASSSPSVAASEESLFTARREELVGKLSVLEHRVEQRREDIVAAQSTLATVGRTMDFLEQEIALVEPLVEDNIAPLTRLLELQREFERAKGERDRSAVSITQAQLAISELETEMANAHDNYRMRAIDELNSVLVEQSELRETLPRLQERIIRTSIRAPMDGVVNRLNFRTPGGYVNVGDVILELVPIGELLLVEARIRPQDIARVNMNDAVRIRLSAYDSAKYGAIEGRVIRISPDAVADEQNGVSYYLVDIAIESELFLEGSDRPVVLMPGITATVDVLSGKRTVFEYFWQPVARIQELALRD